MTYKNFISLFLTTLVVFAVIFANIQSTLIMVIGILVLAIIVDTLCVLRLKTLGYRTSEAIKRLYFYGYKFLIIFNQLEKVA